MTNLNYFKTTKTARYAQLGELSSETKTLWIVLHGYGQLAPYFIRKFSCLQNNHTVIVAPEALHHFYLNDSYDRVGASWMTKEDRLLDIDDYINYLNQLTAHLLNNNLLNQSINLNVLGFSQGGATVCRWANATNLKINKLVLYSSVFPEDVEIECQKIKLINNVIAAMGDNDEYVTPTDFEKNLDKMRIELPYLKSVLFKGKHEILSEVLLQC